MIIKEVYLKNFGRFQKKRISFGTGINVVYGENESGKTTLYRFFQGIFFGLPRGRGLASRTDTYTRCLPWENPSWYEGSILFQAGEKEFRLERNFESRSQEASLYCVSDGEQMSVEEGDLEMLLGGVTRRIYENTGAIGQLKSRTEEGLREELREYLANFQTEGDFRLDPAAALSLLKEKRRKWEKAEKEAREEKEREKERLLYKIQYTREEIGELEEKLEQLQVPLKDREHREEEKNPGGEGKGVPAVLAAVFLLLFLAGSAGVLFFKLPWTMVPVSLIPFLLFLAWYLRERKKRSLTHGQRAQDQQKRAMQEERTKGRQLSWKESLEDKQTLLGNLQEELEELEGSSEKIERARKEAACIALAEKKLAEAAEGLQSRRGNFLKERTWEILGELTHGRYQRGSMDADFQIKLDQGDRYIGLHQVSQGTAEQVYFALRMAAGEMLCQEEEMPVLLDETFAMYDDGRLARTLEWLHKNRRQVILFTCTRRESQILERLGIPWRQVEL